MVNFNSLFLISLFLFVLCVYGEAKEEISAREVLQSLSNTTALRHKYCENHQPSKQCSLETHDCPKDQHCAVNLCGDTFCLANSIEELEKNPKKYLPKSYQTLEKCIFAWNCEAWPLAVCYWFMCIPNAGKKI